MKSNAKLLYDFIHANELADAKIKDWGTESLQRMPDSTVYKESIEYYDGRVRAFKLVKDIMEIYFCDENLKESQSHEPDADAPEPDYETADAEEMREQQHSYKSLK